MGDFTVLYGTIYKLTIYKFAFIKAFIRYGKIFKLFVLKIFACHQKPSFRHAFYLLYHDATKRHQQNRTYCGYYTISLNAADVRRCFVLEGSLSRSKSQKKSASIRSLSFSGSTRGSLCVRFWPSAQPWACILCCGIRRVQKWQAGPVCWVRPRLRPAALSAIMA